MPIKNYTTKISALQTVGEIQGILAAHGARKIMLDYDENGRVISVSFALNTPAGRVAWRIVKDWIDAQMAFLESEQVAFDEIFLPYLADNSGQTLYTAFTENRLKMLETRE